MKTLDEQIVHLINMGALGRSVRYHELLRFLGARANDVVPPTETEIAVAVFAKSTSYNPSVDTIVRVYAHNLRQKLKKYYSDPRVVGEPIITLPAGGYRINFEKHTPIEKTPATIESKKNFLDRVGAFSLVGVCAGIISVCCLAWILLFEGLAPQSTPNKNLELLPKFWHSFVQDDRTILIVYGDLATYSVWDPKISRNLKIRDVAVNSEQDFKEQTHLNETKFVRWEGRTILTWSELEGVHSVVQAIAPFKKTTVIPSSKLTPEMIRDSHIVFVGNLKTLRLLGSFFKGSNYELTGSGHRLVDKSSKMVLELNRKSVPRQDYALLAKFEGPFGGHIAILGGNVAEGVLALSKITEDVDIFNKLLEGLSFDNLTNNYEILIEAFGLAEGTYTSHRLVEAHRLDMSEIWSTDCDQECEIWSKQTNID